MEIEAIVLEDPRMKDFCLARTPADGETEPVCSSNFISSGAKILTDCYDFIEGCDWTWKTMTQEDLNNNMENARKQKFWSSIKMLFDKDFSTDNLDDISIHHMQTFITLGGPLMDKEEGFRYDNTTHLESNQTAIRNEFIIDIKNKFTETNTVEANGF